MTQKQRIAALEDRLLATRTVLAVLIAILLLKDKHGAPTPFTAELLDDIRTRALDETLDKSTDVSDAIIALIENCLPGDRKPLDY